MIMCIFSYSDVRWKQCRMHSDHLPVPTWLTDWRLWKPALLLVARRRWPWTRTMEWQEEMVDKRNLFNIDRILLRQNQGTWGWSAILVGQRRRTDKERKFIRGRVRAKQSGADIKDAVASLREYVLGQRCPAWGPIIIQQTSTHFLGHVHTKTLDVWHMPHTQSVWAK